MAAGTSSGRRLKHREDGRPGWGFACSGGSKGGEPYSGKSGAEKKRSVTETVMPSGHSRKSFLIRSSMRISSVDWKGSSEIVPI